MTYENWYKCSTEIIAAADKYNEWADKAKASLLTNIGPRLEKLRQTGYMGCGFHYSLEQTFGKLIVSLSIPWQPSENWCQNIEKDQMDSMIHQAIYKSLVKQVKEAEKSVGPLKQMKKKAEKVLRAAK